MELKQWRVPLYGSGIDLFVLLLAHYDNTNCTDIQMKYSAGYTSNKSMHTFRGHRVASALLPIHALIHVIRKFSKKGKDFWTRWFLAKQNNGNFIQALLSLVMHEISKFICWSHCPQRTSQESQAAWLRHITFYIRCSAWKQTNLNHLLEHSFSI